MKAFTIFALGPLHASNDYIPWLWDGFFFFNPRQKEMLFICPFTSFSFSCNSNNLFIYLFLC